MMSFNISFWNARGIGNNATMGRLKEIIDSHKIKFLVFAEPKVRALRIQNAGRRLGFDSCSASYANSFWIFWNHDWTCDILLENKQVVFLKIIHNKERIGGNSPNFYAMNEFNNAMLEAGLNDVGYHGKPYTWSNSSLSERIDRVLINNIWVSKFDITAVSHLDRICSDHALLLIEIKQNNLTAKRRFRFRNMWANHRDFMQLVQDSWNEPVTSSCPLLILHLKLIRLRKNLSTWNRNHFGNVFDNIKKLKETVKQLEDKFDNTHDGEDKIAWNVAKAELQFWYNCEETFWKQKAAIRWWKEGDSNTKFFYNAVKKKRQKLHIDHLVRDDNTWIEDPDNLEKSGIEFFGKLLSSESCSFDEADFHFIPSIVLEDVTSR
ncbi:hypothetical protein AXF42_Ash021651 [Apostasia shenzhenica]|uniref:Endonuclease/exonuclease/phosphatase domain-containing protein n=1 Tax=Apostasia shenzhenica TaxID=1088818 RepID=A0A2H9ZTP4_9ASPA|nr:hypothetical protein AXF42_Ash021651 [Apostasia shenzhenica]